ncbi:MAG: hypothetical protein ACLFS8_02080 [Clostridia bacterium]
MKRLLSVLAVLLLLVAAIVASGCDNGARDRQDAPATDEPEEETPAGDPEEEAEDPAGEEPASHLPGEIVDQRPTGPDTFEDVIELEGMEEPMDYVRVELPEFMVATYVPDDLQVLELEPGKRVRIVAAYGGTPRDDVYLQMDLHDAEESAEKIVTSLREKMESDGYLIQEVEGSERQYRWGIREWAFESEDRAKNYVGRVILGNAAERTLVITTHMPAEFGDGTVPRFRSVMDEMKWYLDWE